VFRSPAGFHVLKLLELRGAGAPCSWSRRMCVILLVRTNELFRDEAKRKLLSCGTHRKRSDFAELARLNSDEARLPGRGSGMIYPGDTVTEFDGLLPS